MIQGIDVVEAPVEREAVFDTITLDEGERHRRRIAMTSDAGLAFLLNLPEARRLRDGDAIRLQDGRLIGVRGRAEALDAVYGRDAQHLLMLAWQVGNRHTPVQILPDRLLVRRDPVIGAMLMELGARLEPVEAVFEPVSGAYASHHAHAAHGHASHARNHDDGHTAHGGDGSHRDVV